MSRNYLDRDNSANIVLVPRILINKTANRLVESQTKLQARSLDNIQSNSMAQDINQPCYGAPFDQAFYYNHCNVSHLGMPLPTNLSNSQSNTNTYNWNPDHNNVKNMPAYVPDGALHYADPNVLSNHMWYTQGQNTTVYQNNYIHDNNYYSGQNEYEYVRPCYAECCQPITNTYQNLPKATSNQQACYSSEPYTTSPSQLIAQETYNTCFPQLPPIPFHKTFTDKRYNEINPLKHNKKGPQIITRKTVNASLPQINTQKTFDDKTFSPLQVDTQKSSKKSHREVEIHNVSNASSPQISTHQEKITLTRELSPKVNIREDFGPVNLNVKENIVPVHIKHLEPVRYEASKQIRCEINMEMKHSKYEASKQTTCKINNEIKTNKKTLCESPEINTNRNNNMSETSNNCHDYLEFTKRTRNAYGSPIKIPSVQPINTERHLSELPNTLSDIQNTKKRFLTVIESDDNSHSERKKYKEIMRSHSKNIKSHAHRDKMTKTNEHIPKNEYKTKSSENKFKRKIDVAAAEVNKNKKYSSRLDCNEKLKGNNIVKLIEKNKVETIHKTNRRQELLKEIKRLEEKLKQAREAKKIFPVREKCHNEKEEYKKYSNTKKENISDMKNKNEKCKLKSVVKVSNIFNMRNTDKNKDYIQHKNKYYILKNDNTTIINTSKYYKASLSSHKISDAKRVKEKHSSGVKLKYNTKYEKSHKHDHLTITVSTRNDESDEECSEKRDVKFINKLHKQNNGQKFKDTVETQKIHIANKTNNIMSTEVQRGTNDTMDVDTSFLDDINVDEIVESLNFLNDELKSFNSEFLVSEVETNNNDSLPVNFNITKNHTVPGSKISKNTKIIATQHHFETKDGFIGNCLEDENEDLLNSNAESMPLDLTTNSKNDLKDTALNSVDQIELELKQFFESSDAESEDGNNLNTVDLSSKHILSSITHSPVQLSNISIRQDLYNSQNISQDNQIQRNDIKQDNEIESKDVAELSPYKDIVNFLSSQNEEKLSLYFDQTNYNDRAPINAVVEKPFPRDQIIDLSCDKKDNHNSSTFKDLGNRQDIIEGPNDLENEAITSILEKHLDIESNELNNSAIEKSNRFDDINASEKLIDLLDQDYLEVIEDGLEIPKDVFDELNTLKNNNEETTISSIEIQNKNTDIIDLTTSKIPESDSSITELENSNSNDEENSPSVSEVATAEVTKSNTVTLPIEDHVKQRLEVRISAYTKTTCTIEKLIHQGKYSKIYSIRKETDEMIVGKIFRYNFDWKEKIEKEKKIIKMQADIPKEQFNCVWFFDGLAIDESWCYLMEYFPKNLDQALIENKKPFSIELIQRLAKQLVTAVFIVRDNSIVHTDISPRHILLSASNDILKLCGFDEAHPIDHSDITPMIGSARYRAPEVILGHSAGPSIDVWGTALVLYKMATKIDMFTATTNNRLLYQQMLKFGMVPKQMLASSKFRSAHFTKSKFVKKSITKGDLGIEKHFQHYDDIKANKKWQILLHKYYFKLYPKTVTSEDLLRKFIRILSKMLVIDVKVRLPIEFVCIDKFIH